MFKNKPGQLLRVFAFAIQEIVIADVTYLPGQPVLGIASSLTLRLGNGTGGIATVGSPPTHPTETEDGYYFFEIPQANTDSDVLDPYPSCDIPFVRVVAPNFDRHLVDDVLLAISVVPAGVWANPQRQITDNSGVVIPVEDIIRSGQEREISRDGKTSKRFTETKVI